MGYDRLEMLREAILLALDETGDHTHPRVLALSEEMDQLLNAIMGINGAVRERAEENVVSHQTAFPSQQ